MPDNSYITSLIQYLIAEEEFVESTKILFALENKDS